MFNLKNISIYKTGGLAKSQQSLKNWTKQEWMTSGTHSNKKRGSNKEVKSKGKKRYLPKAAWDNLSSGEKAATNKAKASSSKQFVKQPKSIAKKAAQYRQDGGSVGRFGELADRYRKGQWSDLTPQEQDEYRRLYSEYENSKYGEKETARNPYIQGFRDMAGSSIKGFVDNTQKGVSAMGQVLSTPLAPIKSSIKNQGFILGAMPHVQAYNAYMNPQEIIPKFIDGVEQAETSDALMSPKYKKNNPTQALALDVASGFLEPSFGTSAAKKIGQVNDAIKSAAVAKELRLKKIGDSWNNVKPVDPSKQLKNFNFRPTVMGEDYYMSLGKINNAVPSSVEKTIKAVEAGSDLSDKLSQKKKGGKTKSKVNAAGNYTKPGMRKRLFQSIKAGSKGGNPGQWSARKAQLLAKRYKANGGGYKQTGGYAVSKQNENDAFWDNINNQQETSNLDLNKLPRPNVISYDQVISSIDRRDPQRLELEYRKRRADLQKNAFTGPLTEDQLGEQLANNLSGKLGALNSNMMYEIAKDNPVAMNNYISTMQKQDPQAFKYFNKVYGKTANQFYNEPFMNEMNAVQKEFWQGHDVDNIKNNFMNAHNKPTGLMGIPGGVEGYNVINRQKGGYTVTRSNERKGKTHKVTGPDGSVKYFGDPKMGERSKSKYGKKAFYKRHAKNLKKNPHFRAYARKTWQEGGYTIDNPQYYYSTNPQLSPSKLKSNDNVPGLPWDLIESGAVNLHSNVKSAVGTGKELFDKGLEAVDKTMGYLPVQDLSRQAVQRITQSPGYRKKLANERNQSKILGTTVGWKRGYSKKELDKQTDYVTDERMNRLRTTPITMKSTGALGTDHFGYMQYDGLKNQRDENGIMPVSTKIVMTYVDPYRGSNSNKIIDRYNENFLFNPKLTTATQKLTSGLAGMATEELEHAAHIKPKADFRVYKNISRFAQDVIKDNVNTKYPYLKDPSEVIAKKRAAEVYLIGKGLLSPGEEFTDQHFDHLLNQKELPLNINQLLKSVSGDKTIDQIRNNPTLYKQVKQNLSNIMNKIAANNNSRSLPIGKLGGKFGRGGRPCYTCGGHVKQNMRNYR